MSARDERNAAAPGPRISYARLPLMGLISQAVRRASVVGLHAGKPFQATPRVVERRTGGQYANLAAGIG